MATSSPHLISAETLKNLSSFKVSKLAAHFDLIREGSFKCVGNPACVNGEIKSLIRPPSPPIFLFSSFSSFSFATPSGKKNKLSPSPFDSSLVPQGRNKKGKEERRRRIKRFCHTALPPPSHIQRPPPPPPPFQTPALFTLHLKRGKSVFSSRLASGRGCKNPPLQHTYSSIHIPRTILYGRTRNSSKDDDSIRKEPFFLLFSSSLSSLVAEETEADPKGGGGEIFCHPSLSFSPPPASAAAAAAAPVRCEKGGGGGGGKRLAEKGGGKHERNLCGWRRRKKKREGSERAAKRA